jgi:hypothetical protein
MFVLFCSWSRGLNVKVLDVGNILITVHFCSLVLSCSIKLVGQRAGLCAYLDSMAKLCMLDVQLVSSPLQLGKGITQATVYTNTLSYYSIKVPEQ